MAVGRGRFGPTLLAWTDATLSPALDPEVIRPFGERQVQRYASLSAERAQRFLTGRSLLACVIGELTDEPDLELTATCERCGAEHGRPRLVHAAVAVSVSYAGDMVAVAAVDLARAGAVGVDIERMPHDGVHGRLSELAPLFAPASPPDIAGWTLLEAALKADGRGVTVSLEHVEVGPAGSGSLPGAGAVRLPGRSDIVDAALLPGPDGFVLSAAVAPSAGAHSPH